MDGIGIAYVLFLLVGWLIEGRPSIGQWCEMVYQTCASMFVTRTSLTGILFGADRNQQEYRTVIHQTFLLVNGLVIWMFNGCLIQQYIEQILLFHPWICYHPWEHPCTTFPCQRLRRQAPTVWPNGLWRRWPAWGWTWSWPPRRGPGGRPFEQLRSGENMVV